jgi:alcohol dehydrogenase class IV
MAILPLENRFPIAFDFQSRTRLIYGPGTIERVGELTLGLMSKKILLVTDKGIVAAGHADRVRKNLEASGLQVVMFADAQENPTTSSVEACVAVARAAGIDAIIGLGGGSAMDTAKGCNFLLTNGGRMQDYWGVGKARSPMLPFIAIPTTAGTGSECQSAALIIDEQTHQKMACLDPKAAARIAILDPMLTLSQPTQIAAFTGMDAIAHAVETAVTTKRNELSVMFSREAFRLCATAFPQVMTEPTNLEARGNMLLGAALAGMAIENSMLGAAHAAANPLTAHFGVVHGKAVGLMLPAVVRFNAQDAESRRCYSALGSVIQNGGVRRDNEDSFDFFFARLKALTNISGVSGGKESGGIKAADIPMMAEEAARQWTAGFNPRPISKSDFIGLYEDALAPG